VITANYLYPIPKDESKRRRIGTMKTTYVLAIILIVLFSMGAQCQPRTPERVIAPFNGGIEGLVATFEEIGSVSDTGAKNEVWEDEAFPVEVRLRNKGEFTINSHEVELKIEGISPNDFTGIDFLMDNPNKIDKVSEFMPEGGEDYVSFGNAKYLRLVGTQYDANIFIKYVYPYETYINIPQACYKENIKDTTVCDVDETKQAFASGGPIAVGTVQERYIGRGKILLEIPIKNVQKGRAKAYKNDGFQSNFDELSFSIDDPDWICSARGNPNVARITHPEGEVQNEEVVIRCINDQLEQGALYTKSVTLVLRYYYQDWINQNVRIRENPE
jgi:hypothetical protein